MKSVRRRLTYANGGKDTVGIEQLKNNGRDRRANAGADRIEVTVIC